MNYSIDNLLFQMKLKRKLLKMKKTTIQLYIITVLFFILIVFFINYNDEDKKHLLIMPVRLTGMAWNKKSEKYFVEIEDYYGNKWYGDPNDNELAKQFAPFHIGDTLKYQLSKNKYIP